MTKKIIYLDNYKKRKVEPLVTEVCRIFLHKKEGADDFFQIKFNGNLSAEEVKEFLEEFDF